MAQYTCPDCGVTSQQLSSPGEASQLLATHQQYTCPARRGPVGGGQGRATTTTTTRRRR
ncbi:hypothetical protein [Pseudofrankia sp. DC12]|uniref:hypothetical protein n=1 Tax=Pseudofrankia sp. DC12 TaxID=683315 RepID=UPI000AA7C3D5|nr:hypothetical protein [Pseudofrankia sp. DC12]